MIRHVSSASDPRLDNYRGIQDRTVRRRAGLFVGEGLLVVERMLALPGVTDSVLVAEGVANRLLPATPPDVPLYVAPLDVLRTVAGFDIHRGVVAMGRRSPFEDRTLAEIVPSRPRSACLLACEGITNSDNVGLLFRSAAALGAAGLILDPTSHDPLYRRSVRVSIGHVLTVPWARARDWPADLARLKAERGLALIGAATDPECDPIDALAAQDRCVLVVGSEGAGLARATLDVCDHVVRIPMAPDVDSLNVAVAAAILLHELVRTGRR